MSAEIIAQAGSYRKPHIEVVATDNKKSFFSPEGNLVDVDCTQGPDLTVVTETQVEWRRKGLGDLILNRKSPTYGDKRVVVLEAGQDVWFSAGVLDWSYLRISQVTVD